MHGTPLVTLLSVLLAAPLCADRLITHDGRILEVEKARQLEDGSYRLEFESGSILCAAEFVAAVEIEGDMSDYVPASEDEKKKLAEGYVRYRGKWLTKAAFLGEQKKQSELARARTAELAAHSSFYDAWRKETQHFEIRSNTSPELLDSYAELLESYYQLMDERVGISPSPMLKKTKMKVSIYKSRPEFSKLTDSPGGVAGFFNFIDGELHFYHDYQDPSVSQWIALHEGTHLLTFLIEPQARPWIWINEGLADYFGTARVTRNKRGKLEIEPGQLSLERLLTVQQAMGDGSHVPLEKLFTIPQGSGFRAFEYAHAWSFVYFLNESKPEYEKAFKRFFKDIYTLAKGVAFELEPVGNQYGGWKKIPPAEVRRCLLARLGLKDSAALEDEWKDFILGIPIDAPRARLKRGLATLQSWGDFEEFPAALEDIEAALAGGVEEAQAYWARATLYLLLKNDMKRALLDFQKAVELAPLQASYRADLAQALCGFELEGPDQSQSETVLNASDEALGEAETHFGLACELEPDNAYLRRIRDDFLELLQKKSAGK